MTLPSDSSASDTASGSASQLATLDTPIEDPPLAGFTNTGRPKCERSASVSSRAPSRITSRVTGMPTAATSFFVYSLSIPHADASTPGPTYGTPAISSMPWTVPSSPYLPCSTGKTASMVVMVSPEVTS